MKTPRRRTALALTLVVLALIIIAGIIFVFFQKGMPQATENATPEDTSIIDDADVHMEDQTKRFQTKKHNISFTYPAGWSIDERIDSGSTAEWYSTTIDIKNSMGQVVATFASGGQFGGACADDEPFVKTYGQTDKPVVIPGIGETNFGSIIVERSTSDYGIAYGLAGSSPGNGETSVQCPGMAVNYKFVTEHSDNPAIGSITFGTWYAENTEAQGTPMRYKSFPSLSAAQAYRASEEFGQIRTMIQSLKIGE